MKRILLAAAVLLLPACNDGPTRPAPVASVLVSPDDRTLAVNETLALVVTVRDTRGGAPEEPEVEWATDAAGVATVDAEGVVRGLAPGVANISATVEGFTDAVRVTVAAAPPECGQPGSAVRSLAVGEAVVAGGVTATVLCLDGGVAGKEYVAVPFHSGEPGNATLNFAVTTAGVRPVLPTSPSLAPTPLRPGGQEGLVPDPGFERRLRERQRGLDRLVDEARAVYAAAPRMQQSGTPALGALLRFNVQVNDNCGNADYRTGRVVAVSNHAIVVADTANPAGGLTSAEYQSLAASFDTLVHPVNVAAFGEPLDVDKNGGRSVLFYTRAVNELTPPGSGAYIAGYFFARDLFPVKRRDNLEACKGSNYAEIFYMLVPDPTGLVNSNPRSRDLILRTSVGTLAHEYQHLISASRRLYGLKTEFWDEEVWLNEGMSHVAEELVFYRSAGLAPRQNLGSPELQGSPRAQQAYQSFMRANIERLAAWLASPEGQSPQEFDDDLGTRGSAWAFLRYVADRRGGNEQELWRKLVDSNTVGLDNLQVALGTDARHWMRDWATAMFTDDAVPNLEPRFTIPSWNFRSVYGAYPLATRRLSGPGTVLVPVRTGSAGYLRFGVAPAGVASVRTTVAGGLPLPSTGYFTVVRTR